ncbi:sigma-70 family RNA polymerase sigma factor [Iamia sp. SCSIO 61187]|uniref:sigma-70 family RNA polymerase sigma factor n=1 Tax=Iamia sp. SCSIO 61187 TaxID=2722752 RepID=UPI001C6394CE|nr:sigma-70 family RNA polymerase sigma factor [Iamia sp. SCSIO 61187]QYG95143.1 sigma-70 family RNA polymerase sigma factor [Iamia sp. SCSIO 61187]
MALGTTRSEGDDRRGAVPEPVVAPALDRQGRDARVTGFEAFFREEYPRLVVLLVAVTGSRPVAEELAQEALLRAHVRWDRIVGYERPGAWVRRVALNLASHHRRRRRSEQRAVDRVGRQRPPEPYAYGDGDDFWALVRRLPRRQAAAVALHHLEDRPVAEVALILGCAEGTAKAHLHRGRAALARLLDIPEEP